MSTAPFLYVLYSFSLSESFMLENNGPGKMLNFDLQKNTPKETMKYHSKMLYKLMKEHGKNIGWWGTAFGEYIAY